LRKPIFKGSNDHRGGNDGNNAQVDMNYGTSLGKEKVSSMQLQVSIKRTNRWAKDATGNLFNAFNAIEQRAAKLELTSIAYLVI
jgi:iron complex outermembrane receptor protein